ncbi:hypothetical protein B0T14DRAFT_517215 [Immersiella caudata]|uniref:Fungal N-terminal domain-containing protein n=1 Tax=Immersiella caudata TaxID=314043 RepID=A0AA39WYK3_9PEZI|nr:hypothetical protein B0T14DRAFT_517215 [Immersiella caudata]
MDPISILGATSAVVCFVDFIWRANNSSRTVLELNEQRQQHQRLNDLAAALKPRLAALMAKLEGAGAHPLSDEESSLLKVMQQCVVVEERIQHLIERLGMSSKRERRHVEKVVSQGMGHGRGATSGFVSKARGCWPASGIQHMHHSAECALDPDLQDGDHPEARRPGQHQYSIPQRRPGDPETGTRHRGGNHGTEDEPIHSGGEWLRGGDASWPYLPIATLGNQRLDRLGHANYRNQSNPMML